MHKKFKIILLIFLILTIVSPTIALASWWNPLTWNWNIFSIFLKPQNNTARISAPAVVQTGANESKEIQNNQQVIYKTEETKPAEATATNTKGLENSVIQNQIPKPQVQPEPAISVAQQKAPKIVSVLDSLGNVFEMRCDWVKEHTHYECSPKDSRQVTVSVSSNPEITFTVNAEDPNGKSLTYDYYYEGGCQLPTTNWITNNSCTTDLRKLSFGVHNFVFDINNNDNYGSVGLDATTVLYYDIEE